jgi:hypothetical protein
MNINYKVVSLYRGPSISWLPLNFALFISMSIMYQLYIYGFTDDGEINGGELSRAILKLAAFFLLICGFRRIAKIKYAVHNLPLKLPLFYYLVNLLLLALLLEGAHKQALNIFLFLPFLFVDWNSSVGRHAYEQIFKFISFLVLIQVVTDPIAKTISDIRWENGALVGGLGNPSVMGLFLLIAGLYFLFFLKRFSVVTASFCFLLTIFTGAALPTLLGLFFFMILSLRGLANHRVYAVMSCFLVASGATYFVSSISEDAISDNAVFHSLFKLFALYSLFSAEAGGESLSVSGRLDYNLAGLKMLWEFPSAIIFGHPNFLPMYNGDGHFIAFLVTFGLPFFVCFIFVNLYVSFKHLNSKDPLKRFSAVIIFIYIAFFATNRILDYWPAALVYLMAFSFLAGIRSAEGFVK